MWTARSDETPLTGEACKMRIFFTLPLLFATSAAPPAYRYTLDPEHSMVNARVAFFGLTHKKASFPRMSGGITLSPSRLDAIDLRVTLDARALTATDPITLGRLKSAKFFDVEHYPTVHFAGHRMAMTGPLTATVEGELTARGVTRPTVLQVTFSSPPAQATGRTPINLSARTQIDRKDFGMTAYSLIVGKTVDIAIDARMTPG